MWKSDDTQLSSLLEHIEKKSFNVNAWTFRVAALNKDVSYEELRTAIASEQYPSVHYINAMRDAFLYLPDKLRITKEDLFAIFKRFTLNLQERSSMAQEMMVWGDAAEEEIKRLQTENERLTKEIEGQQTATENLKLRGAVEAYENILRTMGQGEPPQKTVVTDKPAQEKLVEKKDDEPRKKF